MEVKKELGIAFESLIIGMATRYHPQKEHQILIQEEILFSDKVDGVCLPQMKLEQNNKFTNSISLPLQERVKARRSNKETSNMLWGFLAFSHEIIKCDQLDFFR